MRCIGVYGHVETSKKKHMWTLLRRLVGLSSSPWLCFGDFNEILYLDDKNIGIDREASMIKKFRDVVHDCNLRDFSCKCYPFTWSNRRFSSHFIEKQLNRFLCRKDWTNFFHDQVATNLVTWCLYHNPVLMDVMSKGEKRHYNRSTFLRTH